VSFWESLGRPSVVVAPSGNSSEALAAYRSLCLRASDTRDRRKLLGASGSLWKHLGTPGNFWQRREASEASVCLWELLGAPENLCLGGSGSPSRARLYHAIVISTSVFGFGCIESTGN